jgi:mono/diheme cytochrome c family protein
MVSVTIFLVIYLVKTILIFANQKALAKFIKSTKVIEMIVSTLFLVTGVWLFAILGAIKMFQIIKLACVIISIPIAIVAYKRMNKGLALFAFILILSAYGLAEMSKKKPYIPNKVEVTGNADEVSQLGLKTYVANCAMCHGLDGKKQYGNATDLSTSTLDNASIQLGIREGIKGQKGIMPSFSGTLTDNEINAVSAYLVNLRK